MNRYCSSTEHPFYYEEEAADTTGRLIPWEEVGLVDLLYKPDKNFPLPFVEDLIYRAAQWKIKTLLRVQTPLSISGVQSLTEINIPLSNGYYKMTVEQLGNMNALFQAHSMLEHLVEAEVGFSADVMMYDIMLYANTHDEGVRQLEKLLAACEREGVLLLPDACILGDSRIELPGFDVGTSVNVSGRWMSRFMNFPAPKNRREVMSILGSFEFYKEYIPYFVQTIQPLHDLARSTGEFRWGEKEEAAFHQLKQKLANTETFERFTKEKEIILEINDANQAGLASNLRIKTTRRLMGFFSRALLKPEKRYSEVELHMLAVYESLKHWQEILDSKSITIISPYPSAVRNLFITDEYWNRRGRWAMGIQDFGFDVQVMPLSQITF